MRHFDRQMRVIERPTELAQPDFQFRRLKDLVFLLKPQRGESGAIHIFHRNGGGIRVVHKIVNANNVWMCQPKTLAGLALKIIQHAGIGLQDFRNEFQRDFPLELFIVGQPDNPHAALPQNPLECVTVENLLPGGETTKGDTEIKIFGRNILTVIDCHGFQYYSNIPFSKLKNIELIWYGVDNPRRFINVAEIDDHGLA